jgi:hypothetical protein
VNDPFVERLRQGGALTGLQLESRLQSHLQHHRRVDLQQTVSCPLEQVPTLIVLHASSEHPLSVTYHSHIEHYQQAFLACQSLSLPAIDLSLRFDAGILELMLTAQTPLSAWPLYWHAEGVNPVVAILQSMTMAMIECDEKAAIHKPCAESFAFNELVQPWLPRKSGTMLYLQLLMEMLHYPCKANFCTLLTKPCNQVIVRIPVAESLAIKPPLLASTHCFAALNLFAHKVRSRCLDEAQFHYSCELPLNTRCLTHKHDGDLFLPPGVTHNEVLCYAFEKIASPWLWLYNDKVQIDDAQPWYLDHEPQSLAHLWRQPISAVAAYDMLRAYLAWRDEPFSSPRIINLLEACGFDDECQQIKVIAVEEKFSLAGATVRKDLSITIVCLFMPKLQHMRQMMFVLEQLYAWHNAATTHVRCFLRETNAT